MAHIYSGRGHWGGLDVEEEKEVPAQRVEVMMGEGDGGRWCNCWCCGLEKLGVVGVEVAMERNHPSGGRNVLGPER